MIHPANKRPMDDGPAPVRCAIIVWALIAAAVCAWLVWPTRAHAQGVGIFSRPNCATITSPVTGKTECLDTTRGVWNNYDGTGWQSDAALALKLYVVTDPRWGADPTGVVSSDAAITAIKTAIGTSGTGVMYFPCGIYLTSGITITDQAIDIIGCSGTRGFGNAGGGVNANVGTVIKSVTNAPIIKYTMANRGAGPLHATRWSRVENVTLLGSAAVGTLQNCLEIDNRGLVVTNVAAILCGGNGFALTDSELSMITNTYAVACTLQGMYLDDVSSGFTIEGNLITNFVSQSNGGYGLYFGQGAVHNTVIGLDLENNTGDAIGFAGGASPAKRNQVIGVYEGGQPKAVSFAAGSQDNVVTFTKYSDTISDLGTNNIVLGPSDSGGANYYPVTTSGPAAAGEMLYSTAGTTWAHTAGPNLGVAGSTTGQLLLTSSTASSGTVQLQSAPASYTTYALKFPAGAPAQGSLWYFSDGAGATAGLADVGAGSYLRSGGTNTAPLWSTLILPNAATSGRVVYATGTNTWGDSAQMTYDGTTLSLGSAVTRGLISLTGTAGASPSVTFVDTQAGGKTWIAGAGVINGGEFNFFDGTASRITLNVGLQVGAPTGADKGAGTINAAGAYYANGTIGCSGGATTATTGIVTTCASDERLKDIAGPFTRGLDALRTVQPIRFRWNALSPETDLTTEHVGFGAQNVQRTIPEAVWLATQGDGSSYLTLSDRVLLGVVVNALKELDGRLLMLETQP